MSTGIRPLSTLDPAVLQIQAMSMRYAKYALDADHNDDTDIANRATIVPCFWLLERADRRTIARLNQYNPLNNCVLRTNPHHLIPSDEKSPRPFAMNGDSLVLTYDAWKASTRLNVTQPFLLR